MAIKDELSGVATKAFVISSYSPKIADAILKDMDKKSVFPIEITRELAKSYLNAHPKLFQIITGIVIPSLSTIMRKTDKK